MIGSTPQRSVVLLASLLQDVNVLRPLAYIARRDLGAKVVFLSSHRFRRRDQSGAWLDEIGEIVRDVEGEHHQFADAREALTVLQGRSGILFAGSESDVPAHAEAHDVVRIAPASFLTATLQHGYECLGFLHNKQHDRSYGRSVRFAANVVCGWSEAGRLTALAKSEQGKLYVTGPTSILQMHLTASGTGDAGVGLICENLHSGRMKSGGDFQSPFLREMERFVDMMALGGRGVAIRPHPGGQFLVRANVELPPNATLANLPIYRTCIPDFAYGISAPSSVLIDLLLAKVPAAVWTDRGGVIDHTHYAGLPLVCDAGEWAAFAIKALTDPADLMERQSDFLASIALMSDPVMVRHRFASLMASAFLRAGVLKRGGGAESPSFPAELRS